MWLECDAVVVSQTASCFMSVGAHFFTAPHVNSCPPFLVSSLLQDFPIAPTTGDVVLVLDLEIY